MSAIIYPGTQEAAKVLARLKQRVSALPVQPCLKVIMVGHDARSEAYIGQKQKAGRAIGARVDIMRPLAEYSAVLELIHKLNADSTTHGMLVQLPLPDEINKEEALASVTLQKDVDGLSPTNLGRLMLGLPCHTPATVKAVMMALEYAKCKLEGSRVGIVGNGILVGRPLATLLSQKGTTVTTCLLETSGLARILRDQDIIIAAAGAAHLIVPDMVKPQAVVVDVGLSLNPDGDMVGDVRPDVAMTASFITPPVGGIGPVGVACVLENTVLACELALSRGIQ